MKKLLLISLISIFTLPMLAQSANKAEELFLKENYEEALISYEKLLKDNPNSALYLYRYARCAQELGNYELAIQNFDRSGDKYKLKYFYTAECYYKINRFEEAAASYETYLAVKPDTDQKQYVMQQIDLCKKMLRYNRRKAQVTYVDSFDVAKSHILDVYQLSAEAGVLTQDSICFGYKNQFENQWTYATIMDSTTSLIRQYKLLNTWGDTDTLTFSAFAQPNSPYWLSDGVTLYFSACNEQGLGGTDIYVTRYNTSTETYTIPENIGMPFNSSGNDYLYVLDETKGVGYWASDRYSTPDSVRVYKFESTQPILWTAE